MGIGQPVASEMFTTVEVVVASMLSEGSKGGFATEEDTSVINRKTTGGLLKIERGILEE